MAVPMYKTYAQRWFCLHENFLFLTINSFIYSYTILKDSQIKFTITIVHILQTKTIRLTEVKKLA